MRLAINTTFYMATVFALSYGVDQLGIPKSQLLAMVMVTAALGFVSKPLYGALSDRIGRRPIYLAGSLVGALAAFPFFAALESESLWLIMLAGDRDHQHLARPQRRRRVLVLQRAVRDQGALHGRRARPPARRRSRSASHR